MHPHLVKAVLRQRLVLSSVTYPIFFPQFAKKAETKTCDYSDAVLVLWLLSTYSSFKTMNWSAWFHMTWYLSWLHTFAKKGRVSKSWIPKMTNIELNWKPRYTVDRDIVFTNITWSISLTISSYCSCLPSAVSSFSTRSFSTGSTVAKLVSDFLRLPSRVTTRNTRSYSVSN